MKHTTPTNIIPLWTKAQIRWMDRVQTNKAVKRFSDVYFRQVLKAIVSNVTKPMVTQKLVELWLQILPKIVLMLQSRTQQYL